MLSATLNPMVPFFLLYEVGKPCLKAPQKYPLILRCGAPQPPLARSPRRATRRWGRAGRLGGMGEDLFTLNNDDFDLINVFMIN